MRKKLFLILLMLFTLSVLSHKLRSQSSRQFTITSSGGNHTSNSNNRIIWTLSDFITETNGSGKYVTQGFLQPEIWIITGTTDIHLFDIKVYPNPFTTYFDIELPNKDSFYLKLIDISGKIIKEYKNVKYSQRFNLSCMESDIYFLIIVKDGTNTQSTFKLIKLK